MTTTDGGLTRSQRRQVERFLHLFAEIEASLKRRLRLKANDPTGMSALIKRYREKNPYWSDAAQQLSLLADIRNLLTHHRSTTYGYPVAVTRQSITSLERILEQLKTPETVENRYRKPVVTVCEDD